MKILSTKVTKYLGLTDTYFKMFKDVDKRLVSNAKKHISLMKLWSFKRPLEVFALFPILSVSNDFRSSDG